MDILGIPAGNLVDAVGGFLLAGLGAWVLKLRPRTRPTLGLGLFALGFGLGTALGNLATVGPSGAVAALAAVGAALILASAAGLLLVGISFPRALQGPEYQRLAVALAGGAAIAVPGFLAIAMAGPPNRPLAEVPDEVLGLYALNWASALVLVGAFWAVLFLLGLRHRPRAGTPLEPRAAALMSAALILYPPAMSAFFLANPDSRFHAFTAASIVAAAVLAALWVRNAARGPGSAGARNLALFVPAWSLALLVNALATGGLGAFGVARVLAVLVLAYAILRHRLLGIDVKVRWTIKQSTLAAVFLAVFFAVSEAAQELFATEGESGAYVGIGAAAMLVFAMAPLQRLAERVASAAVPGAGGAPAGTRGHQDARGDPVETYRTALRKFLADGRLEPAEEVELARIADALGVAHSEAALLRQRIEAEARGRVREGPP